MKARAPGGFTLLEILIAVMVLSIGLLGFAALQMSSVKNNQEAYLQTQAMAIANDLVSRMRANRDYVNWDLRAALKVPAASVLDNIYATNNPTSYFSIGASCGNEPVPNCKSAVCTPQQMATYDRWEICRNAARLLPEGEVYVRCADRDITQDGDKLNPYLGLNTHAVFARTQPNSFLSGADLDVCSPGSSYTIGVFWTQAAASRGSGEQAVSSTNEGSAINPRCGAPLLGGAAPLLGAGGTVQKACVIMDIQP